MQCNIKIMLVSLKALYMVDYILHRNYVTFKTQKMMKKYYTIMSTVKNAKVIDVYVCGKFMFEKWS